MCREVERCTHLFLLCSAPTPPLPRKRNTSQGSEKAYADFLRYFSPEQMHQLADMFKEVAGVQEGNNPKQSSSSELGKHIHINRTIQAFEAL